MRIPLAAQPRVYIEGQGRITARDLVEGLTGIFRKERAPQPRVHENARGIDGPAKGAGGFAFEPRGGQSHDMFRREERGPGSKHRGSVAFRFGLVRCGQNQRTGFVEDRPDGGQRLIVSEPLDQKTGVFPAQQGINRRKLA